MTGKLGVILMFTLGCMSFAAAVPVNGNLVAAKSCNAYVSKNKKTNPDHTQLKIHHTYRIIEVNRLHDPGWYRVRIDSAIPPERWVAKSCGTASFGIDGSEQGGVQKTGRQCRTAGHEDSYKLALSWQPAFCESHRNKPECKVTDQASYEARNFTLHGLWPNKATCGTDYAYCGEIKYQPGDFCQYPALEISSQVRSDLEQVMPSSKAHSCLQRHEWHKHGTCQTKWNIDQYHEIAIDLTRQFNASGLAYFVAQNLGKSMKERDFFNKVDRVFGAHAHKRMHTKCKNGNLVDIYINLPHNLTKDEKLADLIQRAGLDFKSSCNGSFKIDPIGFAH